MASNLDPWSEPVQRVLHWMMRQVSGVGVLTCPEHGIEHTGKNAGAIVMASELARLGLGDGEALFEFARQQGLRMAGRLEREGDSTCWTFRPGRHDPFNCSNSVIDGGACSDALGTLLEQFGDRFSAAEREILQRACVLHAQTYLRYAAFDKGIPAQRAWALTGVASAFRRSGHEVLRFATVEGTRAIFDCMHADGSFAYHPLQQKPGHEGASDVSAFYQSRPTAFLLYALEAVGEDPAGADWRGPLLKQLRFLAALYGPEGRKVGAIEAKPWYHGAEYEVASHPFDVFALARGARLFQDANLARCALASFRMWTQHLGKDGCPQSHLPGSGRFRSYQCATFWAGHTQWMARSIEDLAWIDRQDWPEVGATEPGVTWFEEAQLARLEDERVVAWVRGSSPRNNLDHGSRVGAGLLRVVDRVTGKEWLQRDVRALHLEGEWMAKLGPFSLGRAWRINREELRFSVWKARNAKRTRGMLAAFLEPVHAVRHGWLGFAKGWASSAFASDAQVRVEGSRVVVESHLALRGGEPVPGPSLRREYEVNGEGLLVLETMVEGTLDGNRDYRVPGQAQGVKRNAKSVSFRLGGATERF
ncbi:MAG: hypothetical protein P1V35_01695 [Planctomycetota bacterium]|nr:hypothetical protein [Planctomycetota bacterium]